MSSVGVAARFGAKAAVAEQRRTCTAASTSTRAVNARDSVQAGRSCSGKWPVRGANVSAGQQRPARAPTTTSRPTVRARTAAAAVEFADESHRAFYDDQQPKVFYDMGMKATKKLAKKIGKQKKSLVKLAEVVHMAPSVLQGMLAELDTALEQVQERVTELERQSANASDSSSSSSDSSGDEHAPRHDDTDAVFIADRLAERRAQDAAAGPSSAFIGAMSVETTPSGPSGRFLVCQGKGCMKRGGAAVLKAVTERADVMGGDITVTPTGCLKQCGKGSCMRVKSGNGKPEFITRVGVEHVDDIFEYAFHARPSDYMSF